MTFHALSLRPQGLTQELAGLLRQGSHGTTGLFRCHRRMYGHPTQPPDDDHSTLAKRCCSRALSLPPGERCHLRISGPHPAPGATAALAGRLQRAFTVPPGLSGSHPYLQGYCCTRGERDDDEWTCRGRPTWGERMGGLASRRPSPSGSPRPATPETLFGFRTFPPSYHATMQW